MVELDLETARRPQMNTSIKVTIIIVTGVLVFMVLMNRSRTKLTELQQMESIIAAKGAEEMDKEQYSLEFDENCSLCKQRSTHKVHLVTNFFPMSVIKDRARVLPAGAEWSDRVKPNKINYKQVAQRRDRELLDVLQMNLRNSIIIAVHLIYNDEEVVKHILNQKLRFAHKLIFHWVDSVNPTYEDAMIYIGKHLRHQLVVLANQDIYLGAGWDVLDHKRIKERNIMYALTRHGKQERFCKMWDDCARSVPYMGSHDAFVFSLTGMPKKEDLKLLRHSHDQFGIENIMIHLFRERLGYEVINPCFVLYIYHVHCARVFSKKRVRVNRFDTTGTAYFVDQLYV